MLSLIRSGLLHMIACVVVFLPLCILVSRVYMPYSSKNDRMLTFSISFDFPVESHSQPVQSHELPPISRMPVSSTSVIGGPSLSADLINQVLSSAGSPAAGTGQGLYNLSVQSGIDDAYALAVFQKESSFGRYGAGFENHALGNIVCAGYPTCNGRFRLYPSWEAGYQDFYQLISQEYVARGLSTVDTNSRSERQISNEVQQGETAQMEFVPRNANRYETITPVYAPSSENDTGLYIQQVRQAILAFRQAQSLMGEEVPR